MSNVPKNVRVLKRIIEKPYRPSELIKELKMKERTIYAILSKWSKYGLIKKLDDGRYASKDYTKLEERVENYLVDKKAEEGMVLTTEHMKELGRYVSRIYNDTELLLATLKVAIRHKMIIHYLFR